jgi:hypothetical protein
MPRRTLRKQRTKRSTKRSTKRRKSVTRGWKKMSPGTHERTVMMRRCGKKCFLGPNKSFPICKKHTCKVDKRGVQAAFNRARQWGYTHIAKRAKKLLMTLKRNATLLKRK